MSGIKRRTTCLTCELAGTTTQLVVTHRGNLCPVHEAKLVAAWVGVPEPTPSTALLYEHPADRKGMPHRPEDN